jgi:nitrate/TMAO reductase-like tetraheme cytochrome c subunit
MENWSAETVIYEVGIRCSLFVTRYSLFGIRCSVLTTNTLTTKIARFSKILILLVLAANALFAQNPNGNDLVIDCKACHLPSGWEIPTKFWELAISNDTSNFQAKQQVDRFDHQLTGFALTGRHERVDCRGCHQSLVFNKTESACVSCHTDVHSLSVGTDCARCHSTNHWLVENLSDIHLQNGFPLSGAHLIAHCTDCHVSDNQLVFNRIGNECINCHSVDYAGTTTPNHALVGYSVDCAKCHTNQSWVPASFDHTLFYPITGAHVQATCTDCHLNGVYAGNTHYLCWVS